MTWRALRISPYAKGYFMLERGAHTVDDEGFGTCGMYFESVYPVLDQNATEAGGS